MSTKIEWCDETWNPVTGCHPISEGCQNCYARRMAETRLRGRCGYPQDDPFCPGTVHADQWNKPIRWKKKRRIFVCSMGDLFHDSVSPDLIYAIIGIAAATQRHDFLLLTKRPYQMASIFNYLGRMESLRRTDILTHGINAKKCLYESKIVTERRWPLPNVWLGVSVENQAYADERVPILLSIPAAVRFVSVEPMLEPIDAIQLRCRDCGYSQRDEDIHWDHHLCGGDGWINWVICGSENGPGARPMDLDWARNLRDQCVDVGVPFFYKGNKRDRLLDGRTWEQFPEVTLG
ncbi:MAG: DUF5131 family protein [candidate division Zixibacteria bacterium]|nr:DUF5131 family protein [candidate division Zixibacteria bacterium]